MKKYHFITGGEEIIYEFALNLHQKGFQVTCNDNTDTIFLKSNIEAIIKLPSKKIDIDLDGIVLGTKVKKDNQDLQKAIELGIRIYSYPEILIEQSREKTRVVIGGGHDSTIIIAIVLHILTYWDREVDYIINTQLASLNKLVCLTDNSDFILIEGDENPSSILDNKPKLLWYKPHIALIPGIEWNYNNTSLAEKNYNEQFKKYIDSIVPGGILIYNESDEILSKIAQESQNTIRKEVYKTPESFVNGNTTYMKTTEGDLPIEFIDRHNLSCIEGAKWICQLMGIDEGGFLEGISSFRGTLNV